MRARPWADLLDRHREEWVASLGGEGAVTWVDDADALRAAVSEGRPAVLGLHADAGGAAEREAGRLAAELGGVMVCQRLAAGSLIGPEEGEAGDAVHFLVCVNIDDASAAAPSSVTEAGAVPLMSGYVRFLEQANRSLSEANVRLARERLGTHDSAAAAIAADLQRQLDTARINYEAMLESALRAPRYRAVDKLRDLLFEIPGVSSVLRLRRRRIQRRSGQG